MRSNGPVCGPASRTGSRCWRGRAWGVLGTFRVTVTIHKSWGRGQGGRGRDTPEFGVEWGVLYGQLHDAAALRRRACQNLQVFQVKPRKPKRAPRQRVRFARCACVTVTIISAPESLGQGNGGYHTEKRAMKLIGRVAGESVGWSGRQLIVNDICRGLRVPHTSALTHTKTRENWRPTVVVVRLPAYSQWGGVRMNGRVWMGMLRVEGRCMCVEQYTSVHVRDKLRCRCHSRRLSEGRYSMCASLRGGGGKR